MSKKSSKVDNGIWEAVKEFGSVNTVLHCFVVQMWMKDVAVWNNSVDDLVCDVVSECLECVVVLNQWCSCSEAWLTVLDLALFAGWAARCFLT